MHSQPSGCAQPVAVHGGCAQPARWLCILQKYFSYIHSSAVYIATAICILGQTTLKRTRKCVTFEKTKTIITSMVSNNRSVGIVLGLALFCLYFTCIGYFHDLSFLRSFVIFLILPFSLWSTFFCGWFRVTFLCVCSIVNWNFGHCLSSKC